MKWEADGEVIKLKELSGALYLQIGNTLRLLKNPRYVAQSVREFLEENFTFDSDEYEKLASEISEAARVILQDLKNEIDEKTAIKTLSAPSFMNYILDFLDTRGYQRDCVVKRLILLTCVSAYTEEPLNLFLRGPSSSGKSFGAVEVSKLFPPQDVWLVGRISPTALIHQRGYYDEEREAFVIDLKHKILIFLETVQRETLEVLLPILSHDTEEIEYKITDKSAKGQLKVKNVIIKGFPATIFCSSRLSITDDVKTRALTATPELTKDKTLAANIAYAERFMSPNNSEVERELLDIRNAFRFLKNSNVSVLIPYAKALAEQYPHNNHEEMRDFKKLISLIHVNAFVYQLQRPRINIDGSDYVLAIREDYETAAHIFKEIASATKTGVPDYVVEWFEKVLSKIPDDERYQARILEKHAKIYGKPIGKSTYEAYIGTLELAGSVCRVPSETDKRVKLVKILKNPKELVQDSLPNFDEFFDENKFKLWLSDILKNRPTDASIDVKDLYQQISGTEESLSASTSYMDGLIGRNLGVSSEHDSGLKLAEDSSNLAGLSETNFEADSDLNEQDVRCSVLEVLRCCGRRYRIGGKIRVPLGEWEAATATCKVNIHTRNGLLHLNGVQIGRVIGTWVEVDAKFTEGGQNG